jgi:cell division septation protein DedD
MIMNEQGGILTKILIIPAGVVVIVSVFLLGFFMGRDQGRVSSIAEKPPALPDIVSEYLPKKEDLTFYRTLTEKGEKTVSIDLKPQSKNDEPSTPKEEQETSPAGSGNSEKQTPKRSADQRTAKQQPASAASTPVAKKETPPERSAPPKIRYTIQVGSYAEKTMAEEEARGLKRRGYAAFLVATDLPEKGTWYRVRIGSFSSRQAAEKLAGELKAKEGISPFITAE